MQLPFLIVHGAAVGTIALIALTLVLAFAGRWMFRWWYRRRARREVAHLDGQTAPRYPSTHAILRGRIRAGTLTTVGGAGMTTHARTGAPWLEHFDGPIALAGEVCVVHGSRFSTKWWHAFWPRTERSVTDGDEVIIDGELTRADDGRWELRSIGRMWAPAPVVEARAIAAVAKPGAVGLLAAAMIVGAIGVASFGVLHHVGTKALDRAWYSLAAAMPGVRDDAMRELATALELAPQNETTLQQRRGIAELAGECPWRALFRAVRFDDAAAEAERCGTRTDRLWAYTVAGRFEDAAHELRPEDGVQPALTIQIALGRWDDAAKTVETAADAEHLGAGAADRCIAALFRAYAGERDAFAALSTLKLDAMCQVTRALARPRPEQAAALAPIAFGENDRDAEHLAALARATTAAPMSQRSFDRFAWTGLVLDWNREIWFGPFIAEEHAHDGIPILADAIHTSLADRAIVRGDLAAARRELAAVESSETRRLLATDLAFVEGGKLGSMMFREELVAARDQGILDRELSIDTPRESCKPAMQIAAWTALGGDGRLLARALDGCPVYTHAVNGWIALLPRVRTHRAELATALRSLRDPNSIYSSEQIPFTLAKRLAGYRTLATLAGDLDEAKRLQAVIERHTAPLADLHKLIGFWLTTPY